MKVLHCPTDTGGNPWGLSRAERKLGVHSDVMVFRSSLYKYHADIDFNFKKKISLGREAKRWKFFQDAIKKYDIFHFNFAKSILDYPYFFLDYLELGTLKKFGKKIFFTFQGCDIRLRDYCLKNYSICACRKCGIFNCFPSFIKRRRINKINNYADKIYVLNPDLIYSCPTAEFLPYASVDINEWMPILQRANNKKKLTILHLPTNRNIKGTKYILDAVNRLKKEGYEFEFLIIEKIPHSSLKEIYQNHKIDLVVDQLLVGWYGAAAVEAMACGVPVVCYIREDDLRFIPHQMKEELPIINAQPTTIYNVIKNIIKDREILNSLSEKSRVYVEKWHNPIEIAKKVIKDYQKV